MDPTLIQLHLSIDNPASGHAARAQEAIALHLEVIRQREGHEAMNSSWRRIWLGYSSLGVASFRLAARLTLRYGLHRLGRKVDPASWAMPSSENSLAV
jgi:hypothetical protein